MPSSYPPSESHARAPPIEIDFSKITGRIRALHGINKGPLGAGGLLDLTADQKALGIPFIRLHDCHWPNPDVVDIHAVFPRPEADPARPESYDFRLTDEYIGAARATGAQIIYRLGESIEHTSVKRYVHPPKDPEKWAQIALGIIRHYNEGWANGFHFGIRYWEVWNEPDNRPAMWTGTDEDYLRLYRSTSKAIKAAFPDLKVDGPAVGNLATPDGNTFQPTPFVSRFLSFCRDEKLPLDFFSWHCYAALPSELVSRAGVARSILNSYGFPNAESHLNEWNYLPRGEWTAVSKVSTPEARRRFYEEMSGAAGAAFIVSSLIALQSSDLDVANLFHGEAGSFGLFTEHGERTKAYYGLFAFNSLMDTPLKVPSGNPFSPRVVAGISEDRKRACILMAEAFPSSVELAVRVKGLPWNGPTRTTIRRVDATHSFTADAEMPPDLTSGPAKIAWTGPGVILITLEPAR